MPKAPGQVREYKFLKVYWQGNDEALDETIDYYEARGWTLVSEGDDARNTRDEFHAVFKRPDGKTVIKEPVDNQTDGTEGLSIGEQLAVLDGRLRKKPRKKMLHETDWWW